MQTSPPHTPGQFDELSHPNREDWMAYLYGELSGELQSRLKTHLKGCPQCHGQVAHWKSTIHTLDAWNLPAPAAAKAATAGFFQPVLRWAVAAAIVLGFGFGLGRVSFSSSTDVRALRRSLESELRAEITAARADVAEQLKRQQAEALNQVVATSAVARAETERVLTELAKSFEEKRAKDNQAIVAALQQLDTKWSTLHASLRNALETVAVLTENGLQDTQQQLYQLAAFNQPSPNR